jgi:hypothetical protein
MSDEGSPSRPDPCCTAGQREGENTPPSVEAVSEVPVHEPGKLSTHGEPDSDGLGHAGSAVATFVGLEDAVSPIRRDALPVVADR